MIFITDKNLLSSLKKLGYKSYDLSVLDVLNKHLLKFVKKELTKKKLDDKKYRNSKSFEIPSKIFDNVIVQTMMINRLNLNVDSKIKENLKNKFQKYIIEILKQIKKEHSDKHLSKSRLIKQLKKSPLI